MQPSRQTELLLGNPPPQMHSALSRPTLQNVRALQDVESNITQHRDGRGSVLCALRGRKRHSRNII